MHAAGGRPRWWSKGFVRTAFVDGERASRGEGASGDSATAWRAARPKSESSAFPVRRSNAGGTQKTCGVGHRAVLIEIVDRGDLNRSARVHD